MLVIVEEVDNTTSTYGKLYHRSERKSRLSPHSLQFPRRRGIYHRTINLPVFFHRRHSPSSSSDPIHGLVSRRGKRRTKIRPSRRRRKRLGSICRSDIHCVSPSRERHHHHVVLLLLLTPYLHHRTKRRTLGARSPLYLITVCKSCSSSPSCAVTTPPG